MDARLDLGIRVAAEYAVHLTRDDGLPPARAIALASGAVVRAFRSMPASEAGIGFLYNPVGIMDSLVGVGSVISGAGWLGKVLTA